MQNVFNGIYNELILRLLAALLVGAAIGLERSYHSRPAGFRTCALVCLSTCLLMLITVYETHWLSSAALGHTSMDPTRMAQGIMTGIGFLGAGVIMQDGGSVRGLTTAASILATAAIGILIGIGFYFPAALAALLTLGILSVFKWIETKIPAQSYAYLIVRFAYSDRMPEAEVRHLIAEYGFTMSNLKYWLNGDKEFFEYSMVICTHRASNISRLAEVLGRLKSVKEFHLSPTGEERK
ncbi:magnesium transport ATPase MgtC [Candidatus Nitrosoglobus terrae]|uniref:Protein MgtC n=1 Tax=Candidatus Nitrosoglobus terrae TaxID=1630141 RepID=A0A1Q2SPA7_9GAMM|nr:MgtC/SapB family protein [Candidatus Nitrosoglobus terrae]BAW80970.1 magnesium transport ATPase MgtC [Candidatus Nitrosoglobus terrae]